jgi:hypothetical protein
MTPTTEQARWISLARAPRWDEIDIMRRCTGNQVQKRRGRGSDTELGVQQRRFVE